jgi:uncharacterized membrane protein YhaH (DUF805 family)
MAFKYLVECIAVSAMSGQFYTPLDFVNPLMSAREKFAAGAPEWFGMAWVLWSLPFLWIAVGMSVRRAMDAGISPWQGLWVLVPFANLIAMVTLAVFPSAPTTIARNITAQETDKQDSLEPSYTATAVTAALGGIAAGALYACGLVAISVYVFHDYGAALFFGTPFITGMVTGFLLNLRSSRSYVVTMGVAACALLFAGIAMLLFALEGAICIMMAAPIVLPLGIAGAPIGKFLADGRRGFQRGLAGALVAVPLFSMVESHFPKSRDFVVTSQIDIAAPPEVVWQNVIDFPKISESPEWYFRLGIACPSEARITGEGVGAERECIFTTGKFVEPITAWDAPRRLAFDVREQPAPMFELTPYRDIHPPHLDGAFRSTHGEFDLEQLPNGCTRLIGRT